MRLEALTTRDHRCAAPARPRRGAARALLIAALAVVACAHPERRPEAPPGAATREEGFASYYGPSFQGRRTASGDRYDARAMTCAHRTLPFGTMLRVTDVETGKSVDVTVTDRGPYGRGRVVDLSWAAARALGILERGIARVIVEVIRPAH